MVGGVAQARKLDSSAQRVERQIAPGHFVIGLIAAVVEWAAEQFFRRRAGQAQRDESFEREACFRPVAPARQVRRIGGDGDVDDWNAIGERRRRMARLMNSGSFMIRSSSIIAA